MSVDSQSLFGYDPEFLTDKELARVVTNLRREVTLLQLENEILEMSITRLDPALMSGVYQALDYVTKMQSGSTQNVMDFSKSASKFGLINSILCPSRMFSTSPSKMSTLRVNSSGKICSTVVSGSGPRINLNEMLELLSITLSNLTTDLDKHRATATKKQDLMKAQIEETEIRINDYNVSKELFKQEVLTNGWDKITQRIPAEVWIRFMRERGKKTDRQIGRLRLKVSSLNSQYRKLKEMVKSKSELNEVLRPVDFEMLQIENDESLKVLERKLRQLDELKTMTGDTNLTLTIHKKFMLFLNNYLAKVRKMKTRRELQTEQLDNEVQMVQVQVDVLSEKINDIKKDRMIYEVPKVLDYVKMKATTGEMTYAIKRLETRLQIKKNALASIRQREKQFKTLLMEQNDLSNTSSDFWSIP